MGETERAGRLVARMTYEEKVAVALGNFEAVAHLGIPALRYTDGPNGIRGPDNVTAFPASLALAATFDEGLAAAYGAAVAAEARDTGSNVLLGPAVDIARAPQGGRLPEAMGEDPYLTSRLAAAEVRGIQDRHVIAMVKHFVGNNAETGRTGHATVGGRTPAVNTVVGERALRELYYPPFKAAVQRGGAGSVMGANAGLDLPGLGVTEGRTAEDFTSGRVPAERLDEIVARILFAIFDAGLDQHPLPDADQRPALASTPTHVALATRIATDGMVLLANRDRLLPLDAEQLRSVAVIGTARDDAQWVMAGSPVSGCRPTGGSRPWRGSPPGPGPACGSPSPRAPSATRRSRPCQPRSSDPPGEKGRACWGSTGTLRRPAASRR